MTVNTPEPLVSTQSYRSKDDAKEKKEKKEKKSEAVEPVRSFIAAVR